MGSRLEQGNDLAPVPSFALYGESFVFAKCLGPFCFPWSWPKVGSSLFAGWVSFALDRDIPSFPFVNPLEE